MDRIAFWKMHGAGNDFILIDDRTLRFPTDCQHVIQHLCHRHTGIGSDGLLLVQPPARTDASLRMRFFNPDGKEAEMCGNAARCLARLAVEQGMATSPMIIETVAGNIDATVNPDSTVTIDMTPPSPLQTLRLSLNDGREIDCVAVNTGVPHVVILVDCLDSTPVHTLGAEIRHHPTFMPTGTNVDFITMTGSQALSIRTYERGVEAETAACGTGITAAAIAAVATGSVKPPVQITTAGGDTLTVNVNLDGHTISNVSLTGPASPVFEGHLSSEFENTLRHAGTLV